MEVVIPTMDFDFNSAHPSPYSSAPSTPKRFGDYYCSAPTSPTNLSDFYHDFDDFFVSNTSSPIPKSSSPNAIAKNEDDFAFDVADESEKTVLPAEELFDAGRIRPLNPPQQKRSRLGASEARKSPSTGPISHLRGAFSPKKKKKEADTFENERGRERNPSFSSSNSGRRGTRSLSPYRVSKFPWEEEQNLQQSTKQSSIVPKPPPTSSPSTSASALSSSSSKGSTRKWRLKDFFLFRSASEGRATDKDPLKKYTGLFWKHEDVKSSSFRSIEGSTSSRRRGPAISAHELHYTVNRAVSEDLKKKTFLPYKQGILGRLAFNPAVHALANGFGFSRK